MVGDSWIVDSFSHLYMECDKKIKQFSRILSRIFKGKVLEKNEWVIRMLIKQCFFLFNGELTGKLFVRGYVQKNFRGLRPRTPDKLYTFFFNGGLIEYLICDDINHFLIPNVPGAPPRTPDRLIGCMYVFYTDGWLSSKFVIMLLAWVNQNFLVASHPDPRQIISLFFFNGDDIIVSFR